MKHDLTLGDWLLFVPIAWLAVVGLAALWLRARERARERPIEEHTDDFWRQTW